jgi:hypothetical protein
VRVILRTSVRRKGMGAVFVALLLGAAMISCSADPEDNDHVFDPDVGQADVEPDADPGNGGEDTETNGDPGPDANSTEPEVSCVGGGFGALGDGATVEHRTEFRELPNPFSSNCGFGGTGLHEVIYFQVGDLGTLTVEVEGAAEVGFELRGGAYCPGPTIFACFVGGFELSNMNWNQHYYLVIHPADAEAEDVDVTLSYAFEEVCEPEFSRRCVDDEILEVCTTTFFSPDVPRWRAFDCPAGCAEDLCIGDSCNNPFVVSGSIQFAGQLGGMENSIDNTESDTCVGLGPVETPSRDMVILLEGLQAEQEVSILVEGPGAVEEAVIMVKESCGSDQACTALWEGELDVVFEAPAAGDYYLILDSRTLLAGYIEVSIEFL